MMTLKDFKNSIIQPSMLNNITGGEHDTPGGDYWFGYGTSSCDIALDNGNYDYYFEEIDDWLQNVGGRG